MLSYNMSGIQIIPVDGVDATADMIDDWKKAGEKVGVVIGLFETLHLGHLRLLQFARSRVSKLIVVTNETSSIFEFSEIGKLCDKVLIVSKLNEADILERLRPSLCFKGAEWFSKNTNASQLENNSLTEVLYFSDEQISPANDKKIFKLIRNNKLFFIEQFNHRHQICSKSIMAICDRFANAQNIYFGDVIVDRFVECIPLGVSKEDGLAVYKEETTNSFLGGVALPFQQNLALGGKSKLIFPYDDISLFREATDVQQNTAVIQLNDGSLGNVPVKTRFSFEDSRLFRSSFMPEASINPNTVLKTIVDIFDNQDVNQLILHDFGLGALPMHTAKALVEICRKRGIMIAADSQSSATTGDIVKFKGATVLAPTEYELRSGIGDHTSGLKVLAEKGSRTLDCKHLFLTLADNGVIILNKKEIGSKTSYELDYLPAFANFVKNVSGAGDVFLTVASLALAAGGTVWEAGVIASCAAALRVERVTEEHFKINDLKDRLNEIYS